MGSGRPRCVNSTRMQRLGVDDQRLEREVAPESPTWRAVLLGAVLVVLLCWAIPWVDIYVGASELAGSHFPLGSFLILLVLATVINPLLRAIGRHVAFSQAELTTIYCMALAAAGIPTYGLVAYLLPAVTAPFYYSKPGNQWAEAIGSRIPEYLRPTDPEAIRMFYEGRKQAPIPWDAWIGPLCYWTIFVVAIYALMFCLTAIIRRQWIEKERLTFPLVELPLEMVRTEADGGQPFFRNRLVWIGAGLVFFIHGLNSLHSYLPAVPAVALRKYLRFPGDGWPLNDKLFIHFSVIGFGYLLATDVSFSVWFFFWFNKIQHYLALKFGLYQPYLTVREPQYIGAFIVFVLYILWRERDHLLSVLRKAIQNDPAIDDSAEALSYRTAVLGVLVSAVVLGVWCVAAGVSFPVFLVSMFVFLLVCLGLTRVVMETGVFTAKVTQMQPLKVMVPAVGTAALGAQNLVMVSIIQYVFMYDLKTFLMPALMHGQRMAGRTRTNSRKLLGAVALAVCVAVVVSYWSTLSIAYGQGGQKLSRWFYVGGPRGAICKPVAQYLKHPQATDWPKIISCGIGATFTALLIFLRQHILSWPLHPIGYILAFSFETTRVWFSFFLGWLVKVLVLKYGGGRLYRQVRFFFLGLILGEFSAAGFWIVVDLILGKHGHVVFP